MAQTAPLKLANLARMSTATTGTGTITLGSAVSGFLTFATAGVNDGDVVAYGIADGSNSEVGTGTYTAAGTTLSRTVTKSTNSDSAINLSGSAEVFVIARWQDVYAYPRGYIAGLTLSNNVGTPNTKVDVAAGACRDSTNFINIDLLASVTIDFTTTGANALDAGTIAASTWYHIYAIGKADGVTSAGLASTSASAPTMPSGYSYKRRIGSVLTDGASHLILFDQVWDEFLWSVPVGDVAVTNLGTTATSYTLTVPTGVQVRARLRTDVAQASQGTAVLVSSLDEADNAPSAAAGLETNSVPVAGAGAGGHSVFDVRTNTSAQVRGRSSAANTTLRISTYGWFDTRGREA